MIEKNIMDKETSAGKFRKIQNRPVAILLQVFLFAIPFTGILFILGIHQYMGISLYMEQYIGLFLALMLSSIFIGIPAGTDSPRERVPWYDLILAMLGFVVGMYMAIFYPEIILTFAYVTLQRDILSIMAVILVLEAIRRTVGLSMVIVVLCFLVYGFFAPYFPGVLRGSHTPIDQLFNYLYLDPNSLINMLSIACTLALAFLLFGQILLEFKGGEILNNFAVSTFGRFRGGPAKAAVVGSSLVGTITGGPVTNVMLVGTVTIPLMKRNGYTAAQAGAVESVASTGGQIMPPVMGIAAFIIAETLGLPYSEIALAALVPAILYYVCLFAQVDLIAGRDGFRKMTRDELPSLRLILKTGWMILPAFVVLLYTLFFLGYTPASSGLYGCVFAVIFLLIQKEIRTNFFRKLLKIFVDTGKTMLDIGVVLSAAGLVVGITGITGLGFNLALMLSKLAENGLFILLVVSAVISVILGMGMPSVAAYTLVAVLVAPAIVNLGVDPVAAHLFVFYFSIISNFTPPVALACFAAAPIAQESPHKIGYRAMKLGLVGYIVPFMFVYAPELLLRFNGQYSTFNVTLTIITAVFACILLAMAVEGFIFQRINLLKRLIIIVLSFCLFIPISAFTYSLLLNVVAFILAALLIYNEWRNRTLVEKSAPAADITL